MKFVKVTDTILMISTGMIQFKHGRTPTSLARVFHKKTQWVIRHDGLYVRKDLADEHGLTY